jgi:hypothetical protein
MIMMTRMMIIILILDINKKIQLLEQRKTHRYLGIGENEDKHQQLKERKSNTRRLKTMLKSKLNAKNKITAIGALAVHVVRYRFGIINWRLSCCAPRCVCSIHWFNVINFTAHTIKL